mgnify:CR=1 FL=1
MSIGEQVALEALPLRGDLRGKSARIAERVDAKPAKGQKASGK